MIFDGIEKSRLHELIKKLNGRTLTFEKNRLILGAGEKVKNIYLCIEGTLVLENVDGNGTVSILSRINEGGIFGGAFAFIDGYSPADLRAVSDGRLLIVSVDAIRKMDNCDSDKNLIYQNVIKLLASKSAYLITKIEHLSKRTTCEKVMSYLNELASKSDRKEISVPYDRQGLADYLCVDRSALSRELSKMKKDGLIDYRKNVFVIKK